jgi:outer membrane lipoprotein
MRIMESKASILLLLALFAMLMSGCATTVSERIARAPADDLGVLETRGDIDAHTGQAVRWGGTIVAVDNDAGESRLEIIARPLRKDGRPLDVDTSPGRFIAVVDDFLDPAIFTEGRDITIYGTIEGERTGRIGERDYTYPVLKVVEYQLWRTFDSRDYPPGYRSMYYYDPWYSPWGPYYHPFPRYRDPPPRLPERRGVLRR